LTRRRSSLSALGERERGVQGGDDGAGYERGAPDVGDLGGVNDWFVSWVGGGGGAVGLTVFVWRFGKLGWDDGVPSICSRISIRVNRKGGRLTFPRIGIFCNIPNPFSTWTAFEDVRGDFGDSLPLCSSNVPWVRIFRERIKSRNFFKDVKREERQSH
jgi:hypothetical protein